MGNWRITIEGLGIHHNKLDGDADAVTRVAVKTLKEAGSKVMKAELQLCDWEYNSVGEPENLLD